MKKRTAIITISVLAAIAIAATAFTIVTINKTKENESYIKANYRHAFDELVTGVSELDNALRKSVLVTSPSMAGMVCTEVFGKAQTADMALGVLPFSATELEKTSAFINRVGDYAFALTQKAANGEAFTEEERKNLRALSDTAAKLSQNLRSIQDNLGSGLADIEQYQRTIKSMDAKEDEILPQTAADSMSISEMEFPELPALIYDGPFSEHLQDIKPRVLEGLDEIDSSQGRRIAGQFLGIRPEQIYPSGEINGKIPSFTYGTEIKGEAVSITLSKQGGVVYQVVNSHYVETAQLTAEEAMGYAKKFLERHGYTDMKESYYLISNNVLTANFAWVQDGVVCYSDLIKVGIALDDGSLQSFEASGYITSHALREMPEVEISEEDALASVPEDLNVLGTELALVPNAGKREILCHEIECEDANGQRFIIYVNAVSGEQEKILIILQDENGTLTI